MNNTMNNIQIFLIFLKINKYNFSKEVVKV